MSSKYNIWVNKALEVNKLGIEILNDSADLLRERLKDLGTSEEEIKEDIAPPYDSTIRECMLAILRIEEHVEHIEILNEKLLGQLAK